MLSLFFQFISLSSSTITNSDVNSNVFLITLFNLTANSGNEATTKSRLVFDFDFDFDFVFSSLSLSFYSLVKLLILKIEIEEREKQTNLLLHFARLL